MIDWLTSETGTYVFLTAVISLYVGFVAGVYANAYFVRDGGSGDDDGGGDSWFPPAPDFPPDELLADDLPVAS